MSIAAVPTDTRPLRAAPAPATGRVYLVGAGPGDPELLTLKAARLLQQADVVLHDALVDARVLALAVHARLVNVGKRSNRESTSQRFINRVLVTSARRHGCVVRLKGGDPVIFGRLDEETRALEAAGIAFEVVPGVTAASAAAASLKVSLTLRGVARSVRFITPRVALGEKPADPGVLRTHTGETIAVYMGGELVVQVAARLRADGHTSGTPLVIVENASGDDERHWAGTLATAAHWPGSQTGGPVLLLIGDAFAGFVARAGVERVVEAPRLVAAA
jgi:uroporphyrin-III C-methyltransferase